MSRQKSGRGGLKTRRASHAGSWYSDDGNVLEKELDAWINASGVEPSSDVRAVIAPHAGFSYSGPCAAFAFGHIDPSSISRVFLLGPSHHLYSHRCLLSSASVYETPVGNLEIDHEVVGELKATGEFEEMSREADEAEHSLEMHLPYLALLFRGKNIKLVPIMVGALHADSESKYGLLLSKYMNDPGNFFSISSDFCHWGSRFSYTPHSNDAEGPIHKCIEGLDREGMQFIEEQNAKGFSAYLHRTRNTICGRHPIAVFLHVLKHCDPKLKVKFVQYEQSSKCVNARDSSVSYASAIAFVSPTNGFRGHTSAQ